LRKVQTEVLKLLFDDAHLIDGVPNLLQRHPREGGDPRNSPRAIRRLAWMPAFAGMTSLQRT
jgi:hypothetical protein